MRSFSTTRPPVLTSFPSLSSTSNALALPEPTTAIFCGLTATRLYLLYSLVLALRPLRPAIKAKDKIEDIPLTPSQRSLLGLEPLDSGRASTDSSAGYITPPRYRRFSGSLSSDGWSSPVATDRRSTSATYYSSSPLSGTRNFSPNASNSPFRMGARLSGTPFSPSASPLLQKAIAVKKDREARDGADLARRQTLGTPSSGPGRSRSLRERGQRASDVGVDSPSDGLPRRNPGLNYKWIYETGGRLPKSETMQF